MMSKAKTPAAYIAELPADRRAAITAVRKMILKKLPKGYEEGMGYGMIGYFVPLATYPKGYCGKKGVRLPFLSLASQKNYMSLYMMCLYGNERETEFRKAYIAAGKKLDMGKGCLRFKTLDDLAMDVVGKTIASVSVKRFVANYEKAQRDGVARRAAAKKKAAT